MSKEKDKEKDKEKEKLEKKLSSILSSTSSAKAWSDLLPIVKNIYTYLNKAKDSVNFGKLSNRLLLAKLLAQCLSPEFPNGVHEVVLDIYYIILHNTVFFNETCLTDNLGIYSCGLFPFFPNASLPNKKRFKDKIIYGCFLCFRPDEITLCLPGLLTSLIQGLDDNNETTRESIYTSFKDLINKVTENVFYGIFWTLILRNTLLRSSGMKFLSEKIMKYENIMRLSEEEKNEIISNQFPNINTVVVNALCQVIEEKEIATIRNGMDFIMTRLPLTKNNTMITDKAKITLLISALKLLIKNESSTTRRLKSLIFGVNDLYEEVDLEGTDMQYKIDLVVQAFLKIFNPEITYTQEQLKNNLKIIDQFLTQEIDPKNYILPKISYDILLCVLHYWQTELNSSENVNQDKIIIQFLKLSEKNKLYLEWFWIAVGNNLKDLYEKNKGDEKIEIDKKINDKKLINTINEALQQLKFILLFLDIKPINKRIKNYLQMITHLLNIMNLFQIQKRDSLEKIRQLVLTTLALVKGLQEDEFEPNDLNQEKSGVKDPNDGIGEGNKNNNDRNMSIFQELEEENKPNDKFNLHKETSFESIQKISENNSIDLLSLTNSILNYQKFYADILEKYLKIKKDSQITKNEMMIFRYTTEVMIRLQEYAQQEEIPNWILYLQKIIFSETENMKLSLESANYLIDMNSSLFSTNQIYKKIKDYFQNKDIDPNVIDQKYLENLINKTGVNKNCQELLMGKLYLVLSDQSNQKNILDLLIKIEEIDRVKFLNMVKNTFNNKNFESIKESMKLFSDFWKLSNDYYNEKIFFKYGECIFQMLDSLDDDNPLLRHLSTSWLNQTFQKFDKILDPIYSILLDDKISMKVDKDIIVNKEFNTSEIRKAYKRLKNIILNSSAMNFMTQNNVSRDIKTLTNLQILIKTSDLYLDILISITLKFTQCECDKSLPIEFQREIYSVNASSCEFLEFLLNNIYDHELLMKYAILINSPIISLLEKAIKKNDEVMQVQLLAVLRVLYIKTSRYHLKNKENALVLFKNEGFHNILINGITSDYFFVRENFINFTVDILPHFNRVMKENAGLKTFYHVGGYFISKLTKYIGGRIEIDEKGRKDTERFSLFDNKTNNIIFKNYLDEYKEYKRFDETDILMLLTGLRDILFQFMGEKIEGSKNDNKTKKAKFGNDFKKLLTGNRKNSNSLDNWFNTNLIDNENNQNKKEGISAMPKNLYCNQIYNLMSCLLISWINQSEKYENTDFCLNLNGILPINDKEKIVSLSEEDIKKNMDAISQNPIKKIIIQIADNLFKTNPIQFIDSLLNIWCSNKNKNQDNESLDLRKDKQYPLSIIELLIALRIPLNIILFCFAMAIQKNLNVATKDKYKKSKEKKCFITPYSYSVNEAKYLHFIYSYILLTPNLDPDGTEKSESWKEMINLLNIIISDTKIIYTYCWIYELLELTLHKIPINNIKDNNDIKKLIDIFSTVTSKLMDSSFEDKIDSRYLGNKKIVLPYLPHIYYNLMDQLGFSNNLYKKFSPVNNEDDNTDANENNKILSDINEEKEILDDMNKNKGTEGEVNAFYTRYQFYSKACSEYIDEKTMQDEQTINSVYRKLSFIILKCNFHKIALGIYSENISSVKKLLVEIIKSSINMIKQNNQADKKDGLFFAENSTDFLLTLMTNIPELLTKCGKDLFLNYLNEPTFFVTTPKMLRNWKKIFSISVKHYPELLSDLIKSMGGGFLSLGSSDEDKIKTLRRISFIIYSCEKDTFGKEFDDIKSKAKELLVSVNKNNRLKDEIFLMMRVLFLRFSHDGVMKMIRDLWPIIFMELIQNIEDPNRNIDKNLVIESFKFIELLSLANVEEFCLYQWNFILDTYNMNNLDTRDKKSFLSVILDESKIKVFKPIAVQFLKKKNMLDTNDENLLKVNDTGKSELYICPGKNDFKALLEGVKKFFYSIGDMNSYKVPVNYNQIEDIIENDFLDVKIKK